MSGKGFIAEEPIQRCEQCGTIAECRPYGPNNEQICFDCAMKDDESKMIAEKKMAEYIFGVTDGNNR
jgi:hypothetical protein